MERVREMFVEYQEYLAIDFCFQGFDEELARLPGYYAFPEGRILLGWEDGKIAGGVALRPLETGMCEMKRLFVRPDWRGRGLGRRLAHQIVDAARDIGYKAMRLDTEKRLTTAIALYRQMGFAEIGRYYDNPLSDILYMELDLTP